MPDFWLETYKSKALSTAIRRIETATWDLTLKELDRRARPTPLDRQLKIRLWGSANVLGPGKRPKLKNIYSGLCTYTHFYNNVLGRPDKLAWLLKPSSEFEFSLACLEHRIIGCVRDIIELTSPVQPNGSVNVSAANRILRGFELLNKLFYGRSNSITDPRGDSDTQ
jgi:hypothetical protein